MGFCSSRPTWPQPQLSAQSAGSRDQHWVPNVAPSPGLTIQLPDNRLFILDCFYHGRDSVFPSWNSYSGQGFAFSAHNASTRNNIHGFAEWLTHHSIPHSVASDQVAHLTATEWQWALPMGFTALITFPIILKHVVCWNRRTAFWRLRTNST